MQAPSEMEIQLMAATVRRSVKKEGDNHRAAWLYPGPHFLATDVSMFVALADLIR